MKDDPNPPHRNDVSRGIVGFFTGWKFPVFVLAAIATLTLPVLIVILAPESSTGLGRLARDFATWCFGYDATGGIDWVYLLLTVSNPALLGAVVVGIWWIPLREAWQRHRGGMVRWAIYGAVAVVGAATLVANVGDSPLRDDARPFPASRLRTALEPPEIDLVDQNRRPTTLREFDDRVVLVTAVYASCQTVCPRMIERIKEALDALSAEQRSKVVVLAVTLDPENDRPEQLAGLARRHGVDAPRYHFLTGPPAEVEETLRELGVSWSRNPETGMIQHSSLFVLVDTDGSIAYRLSLGSTKRNWLHEALDVLTSEALDE